MILTKVTTFKLADTMMAVVGWSVW